MLCTGLGFHLLGMVIKEVSDVMNHFMERFDIWYILTSNRRIYKVAAEFYRLQIGLFGEVVTSLSISLLVLLY